MKMGKVGECMILESGSQVKYHHWFLLFEFCIVRKTWRCEGYLLSSNQEITNSVVADLSERAQG